MLRGVAVRLTATLFALAANGCSGYSDGSTKDSQDASTPERPHATAPMHPRVEPPPSEPSAMFDASLRDAAVAIPDAAAEEAAAAAAGDDMDAGQAPDQGSDAINLRFVRSASFDGYLTDAFGQPLYIFAGDTAGSSDSACLDNCARDWPPFDLPLVEPSSEIAHGDLSRIHRKDGAWQTTYKGYPLYYRAVELGERAVTGDAVDGQFFVARDYLVFIATARTFAPAGGNTVDGSFLTDGRGRTLYACLDDAPRTAAAAPISTCDRDCQVLRPIFAVPNGAPTPVLPSTIAPATLGEMVRPDGPLQFTYRGWPLYYFSDDVKAGSTAGHNDRAWRAIDPSGFALAPDPSSAN